MKFFYFFLMMVFLFLVKIKAQSKALPVLEREVTFNANNETVQSILDKISKQAGFVFSYSSDAINANRRTSLDVKQKTVRQAIHLLFDGSVTCKAKGKYIILKKANPEASSSGNGQVVEGYLYDSRSGKKLSEASIYNKKLLVSSVTNSYGYFRLEIPSGETAGDLRISKQGYSDTLIQPLMSRSGFENIELSLKTNGKTIDNTDHSFDFEPLNPSWLHRWMISKDMRIHARNLTDTIFRKVQLSFLPFISTNKLLTGNAVNNVSFNMTVGYVKEVKAFEAGGVLNMVSGNAGYCQLGGVGNIVGDSSRGFQASGVLNIATTVKGVQAAGVLNRAKKIDHTVQLSGVVNMVDSAVQSFQLAGVMNNIKSITGQQISGVINLSNAVSGFQLAGVTNLAGQIDGFQMAGVMNSASQINGFQIAGVMNQAGLMNGFQVAGVFNNAREMNGIQLSACLNKATIANGVQIGLINIDDSCTKTPVGFFSYVKKGYHQLEISSDEVFYVNAAFRTGVKRFHNIFMAGIRPGDFGNPLWTFGYGVGTSFGNAKKITFDIDLSSQEVIKNSNLSQDANLYKLYLGIDKNITSKIALAAGLTYNLLLSGTRNKDYGSSFSKIPSYYFSNSAVGNGMNLKSWIGGKIALRLF
jgi:hypothetical protein